MRMLIFDGYVVIDSGGTRFETNAKSDAKDMHTALNNSKIVRVRRYCTDPERGSEYAEIHKSALSFKSARLYNECDELAGGSFHLFFAIRDPKEAMSPSGAVAIGKQPIFLSWKSSGMSGVMTCKRSWRRKAIFELLKLAKKQLEKAKEVS